MEVKILLVHSNTKLKGQSLAVWTKWAPDSQIPKQVGLLPSVSQGLREQKPVQERQQLAFLWATSVLKGRSMWSHIPVRRPSRPPVAELRSFAQSTLGLSCTVAEDMHASHLCWDSVAFARPFDVLAQGLHSLIKLNPAVDQQAM